MDINKSEILFKIENLNKYFMVNNKIFRANDNINLSIFKQETLSIIGESGSGKSTLGQLILQLQQNDQGNVWYFPDDDLNINLSLLKPNQMKIWRPDLQIIFQNSFSALNPKFKVRDIIGEGLIIHQKVFSYKDPRYYQQITDIMNKCGLSSELMERYPAELSGGQRQRVNIAKTLILKPKFVVCDEIVSALDVTVQKQILDLLNDFKKKYKVTYLFISHDLGVAQYISDRIGVMYKGKLVELSPTKEIFQKPIHFYTKELLNAIPRIPFYETNC
ncbi:ATP-binding cassette domain-containing protein [Candidatus Phytoplasma citri]|uniref:ABC transporter ATP-binding protein n=1 Tax=Candidatus Phytoplasma citri TaxID=180978 RepID=A0ABU8ZR16_9MOLU|nr:ABC transporter ATP-binding protein [Candidatus Phytoplasma aurantifolia]MDO8060266.1 ABC transporter ATP-binding protein [Candidatus Phytoplasma aurantifolia]